MATTTRTERADQSSVRRTQILAIAARLIATQGYSATTVRDIADEAGILSGSLYHHFSSKEAILEEVLRSFMDGLLARFEEIVSAGTGPRETFDALVQHSFLTIEREPDAVGLYQNESAFLATQPGFEFLQEKSSRIEALWLTVLREGQAAGAFRGSMDVGVAYRFLRDSLWSTVRWFRPGGRHTAQSVSGHFLDLFHNGLLAD